MNTRNITTFAAIAAACFAGSSAYAGSRVAPPSKPIKEILSESCITGDLGVDVVSNYISKGIVYENQGLIVQPYADLHFRLYKGAGPVNTVTADIGIWNSFHDNKSFSSPNSTTSNWFEFDFQAGLTLGIDRLSISPLFKVYQSPNDAFPNVYTIGLNLAYDDHDLLGDFSLHPHIYVELELEHTNGNGTREDRLHDHDFGGNGNGQYYEIGIAPGHTFGPVALTIPISAGFGTGEFYQGNRTFGFFSVGADVAYALNFVPTCLGVWTVHAGAAYYRLGEGASRIVPAQIDFNTGNLDGDKNQWVFGGGLKVAF